MKTPQDELAQQTPVSQKDVTKENPATRIKFLKSILLQINLNNPDLESVSFSDREEHSATQPSQQDKALYQILLHHRDTRQLLGNKGSIDGLSENIRDDFFETQLMIAKMIKNSCRDSSSKGGQTEDFFQNFNDFEIFFQNFLYLVPNSENQERFITTLTGPHNFELPNGEFSLQNAPSNEQFLQILVNERTNTTVLESMNYISFLRPNANISFDDLTKAAKPIPFANGQEVGTRSQDDYEITDARMSNILKAIYLNMVYVANTKSSEELQTYFGHLQQLEMTNKVKLILESNKSLVDLKTKILDSCGFLPSRTPHSGLVAALGGTGNQATP